MDRRVDVSNVREMILLAKKHGIQAALSSWWLSGETDADVQETLQHLKLSDPDHYTITVAYPIKGTPLYQEVEHQFTEMLPWEIVHRQAN
jgi:biotin synthase-like enzyme